MTGMFATTKPLQQFIDGASVSSATGQAMPVEKPVTSKVD